MKTLSVLADCSNHMNASIGASDVHSPQLQQTKTED